MAAGGSQLETAGGAADMGGASLLIPLSLLAASAAAASVPSDGQQEHYLPSSEYSGCKIQAQGPGVGTKFRNT